MEAKPPVAGGKGIFSLQSLEIFLCFHKNNTISEFFTKNSALKQLSGLQKYTLMID